MKFYQLSSADAFNCDEVLKSVFSVLGVSVANKKILYEGLGLNAYARHCAQRASEFWHETITKTLIACHSGFFALNAFFQRARP